MRKMKIANYQNQWLNGLFGSQTMGGGGSWWATNTTNALATYADFTGNTTVSVAPKPETAVAWLDRRIAECGVKL